MAELVVSPLLSTVMKKASSYLLDQYRVMEGMEEQRKILERKLPAILDIIQDAEEKGAYRPGVRAWLKDLKTVSYEANDVFDEFKYEALRREAQKKGHHRIKALTIFPARNPIVFRYRMGKKLCRIVQTVEILVTEMNTFGFRHLQQAPPSKQWRKTDPVMVDSDKDIISRSREEEKKKIMKILLDEASSKDLTVLPIVGMGGLGKTTFVQLIYNDPAIEKHFELRRWCCVSDDFDTANIASSLCQTNINDKGREKALKDLQSMISGKRYLIVLDDVWEPDGDKWGKLKTCLKHGGMGSAILTTTRNAEIARRMAMGVREAYNIEKLSSEHLKEIVESRAFSFQKPNHRKLDEVVDRIVDRCAGSPLAAKAFGSMLSTKTSMNEWKDILAKSNICEKITEILPILKLSFDDLPSHMKQCFAFCAIFPKDYEIDVELLIQLWMAHDLIPVQEEDHPETVGAEIFQELTWRSFFQDVEQTSSDRLKHRKKTTCKIHDLMHDIALSVMGKECVTMIDNSSMKKLLHDPTHHAFLPKTRYVERIVLDEYLKKQSPTLRTLFSTERRGSFRNISKCTSLRVLHMPMQIVGMKRLQHLRYLNLSGMWQLKELPEDISIMYNLQTLDLTDCECLRQLPKDMKYMSSLRHLYTSGCNSLTCMPPGLGQITSLQTITYFVVGVSGGCSTIGELQSLNLGGELQLTRLQNAIEDHAKEASLENKEKLTHLSLEWNGAGQEEEVQDCHQKVLHALEPHDGLQLLRIVNYKGTSLPSWISNLSLLTELHLLGCVLCEEFPQFCHLKALQVLYLERLDKLQSLCSNTESMTFLALKELKLHDLESLEGWVTIEGKEPTFPALEKIDIKNCPKLTCLPEATFLALKELKLHDLESLEGWVTIEGKEPTFPALEKIDIKNCPKLTCLPEAPNLKDVKLDERKALLSLELVVKSRRYIRSLSTLELSIGDTEEATPPQIDQNHESSLSKLKLTGCNLFFPSNNLSQPIFGAWKWFGKLVSLEIWCCDALTYWPEDVFQCLVLLKNLTIHSCNKLIGRTTVKGGEPTQTAVQILPHLYSLRIYSCESLTELFILPTSLRTIDILGCSRLEFVFESKQHRETCTNIQPEYYRDHVSTGMIEQLPSPTNHHPCLENLLIISCDNLATLPNLPPSLKILLIIDCEKLCSVSGHLDALERLRIESCHKLQSLDSLGNLPSSEKLRLENCRCLASLPGVLGSYSALRELTVIYCPAIDLKPLYKRHQHRLDSLEVKNISSAHSSNPYEGPKLREPRSWAYAIPGVKDWTSRRRWKQY